MKTKDENGFAWTPEVDAENLQELDAEVAEKVLQWTNIGAADNCRDGRIWGRPPWAASGLQHVPKFSTNDGDAMELLQTVRQDGQPLFRNYCHISLRWVDEKLLYVVGIGEMPSHRSPSLALAICQVLLDWMEYISPPSPKPTPEPAADDVPPCVVTVDEEGKVSATLLSAEGRALWEAVKGLQQKLDEMKGDVEMLRRHMLKLETWQQRFVKVACL